MPINGRALAVEDRSLLVEVSYVKESPRDESYGDKSVVGRPDEAATRATKVEGSPWMKVSRRDEKLERCTQITKKWCRKRDKANHNGPPMIGDR